MKELVVTGPALNDLLNILEQISKDNPAAAVDHVERVEEVMSHLAEHPEIGKRGRARGTRELAVDETPYVIQYEVLETSVVVLHVLHGRYIRKPPRS